jgi:hypothetical protein
MGQLQALIDPRKGAAATSQARRVEARARVAVTSCGETPNGWTLTAFGTILAALPTIEEVL